MRVCVCARVCMRESVFVCLYVCVRFHIRVIFWRSLHEVLLFGVCTCACVRMSVRMSVYVPMCVCVCLYVSVYVCVYMCIIFWLLSIEFSDSLSVCVCDLCYIDLFTYITHTNTYTSKHIQHISFMCDDATFSNVTRRSTCDIFHELIYETHCV